MEHDLIRLTCLIAALSAAVPSLEFVVSWSQTKQWFPPLVGTSQKTFRWAGLRQPGNDDNFLLLALMGTRVVGAVILAGAALLDGSLFIPLVTAAILSFLSIRMRKLALDGADQMTTITLTALSLGCVSASRNSEEIVLCYIAAQSLLSYLTAGIAKLVSREWMRNGAVGSILNNYTYGHVMFANVLVKHRRLNVILSAAIGTTEVLLPVLAMLPGIIPLMIALGLGVMFHLGCAVAMGLNNFVWAFVATYPAIYYLHTRVYG